MKLKIVFPILILLVLLGTRADTQEVVNSEYRVTFVPTYPISKNLFITTYLGYVKNTGAQSTSYYIGAPLIVTYKPSDYIELMGGAFLVVNKIKNGNDNNEFRPLLGAKFILPNDHKLNIYNWTRYEYRSFIYSDKSLNNVQNRIRNRFGIEFPISKKAWQPDTWYGLSDFEFFYTFEKGYFDLFRQRFGAGYVVNKKVKAEFIYHLQLKKTASGLHPEWTDDIFRLNVKYGIPHRKHAALEHAPDMDE